MIADAYGNQAIDLDSDGNIALNWLQNTSGYAVKSVRYQADLAAWRDVETLAAGSFILDHGQTLLGNGDVQIDWRAPASVAGHFAVLDQSLVDAAGYAVHNDHLGTPQRITDSAQVVVWAADYLPFGEAQVGVGLVEENNRFPGQYFREAKSNAKRDAQSKLQCQPKHTVSCRCVSPGGQRVPG